MKHDSNFKDIYWYLDAGDLHPVFSVFLPLFCYEGLKKISSLQVDDSYYSLAQSIRSASEVPSSNIQVGRSSCRLYPPCEVVRSMTGAVFQKE